MIVVQGSQLAWAKVVNADRKGGCLTECAEHGPSAVDQLNVAVLCEGRGVGGQTDRVPAVVASELASEVLGRLCELT
jgi:hypothetical protein